MTEMFGEAWPPMSVPDLAPDDDDDDGDCRNKLYDSNKGKKRGFPNLSSQQELLLFEMSLKMGSTV